MNRLAKLVGAIRKSTGLDSYDRYLMEKLRGGTGTEALENPYSTIDLVYSCISITAKAIAQVPLIVYKKNRSTGIYDPVGDDNPWQRLIDHPNYMTSKIMFVTGIISFLMLDGCVAMIPFPPGGEDQIPLSIWTVRWKFMEYETDDNGHLTYWIYKPKPGVDRAHRFKPHDVFQVKFWNPDSIYEGISPLEAGKLPILELYKATQYNHRFFDQGAVPGGLLSTPQKLHPDTVRATKEQWSEKHRGWQKAHEIAVLQQDLKWLPTGITQKDMDFVQLRATSQDAIMEIYGMKKVILGKEALNYATAREQRKEWWNTTCLPLMRMVSDALNFGLFLSPMTYQKFKDYRVLFDISSIEALHEDYSSKVKTAEGLFRMGVPFMDINEMLELGFENKDWYKLSFVPVNMMCINFEDVGRPNPSPPGSGGPGSGEENQPTNGNPPKEPEEDDDKNGDKSVEVLTNYIKRAWERQVDRMAESAEAAVKVNAKNVSNRIRRAMFDMRSETLKSMLDSPEESLKAVDFQLSFRSINSKLKEGIIPLWDDMAIKVTDFLNPDEKKVDIGNKRAINESWNILFLQELDAMVNRKRKEVSAILLACKSKADAVLEVRKFFNESLNEAWPMVKAEIKRIVILSLNSAP